MTGYDVKISEASRELSARERISFKDLSNAVSLDSEIHDEADRVVINPVAYVVLNVHNEHSKKEKDYSKFLVIDRGGTKFVTGSKSFFEAFLSIFKEMAEAAPDEEYSVEVYKIPSKNYSGKYFLSCSLVP